MKFLCFVLVTFLAIRGLCQAAPPGTESSPKEERLAVEEDGVVFQVVLPKQTWSIPKIKSQTSVPVTLSLQITNKQEKPLRFRGPDTLSLDMLGPDGKEVSLHSFKGPMEPRGDPRPQEIRSSLVMPGRSTTFSIRGDLLRPTMETPDLLFNWWRASGLPGQFFDNLKPGAYRVRIVYENQRKTPKDESRGRDTQTAPVWTGRIATPFVTISLGDR